VEFGNSRNYTNMEKVEMIVLLYRAERIGGYLNLNLIFEIFSFKVGQMKIYLIMK